jgi:hypothetical protein
VTVIQSSVPAKLWSAPEGPWPSPPVRTRPALLPIGELSWEDTERLFARLLETQAHVEQATLYGVSGQSQGGIDVYARSTPRLEASEELAKGFVALQSRRVKKLSASSINAAVADFLTGAWADRCSTFYYATSHSLRDIKLDAAIRTNQELLQAQGLDLVPWGAEQVSDLLRQQPRLVDDFFGRDWVKAFCGEEQLSKLARRIPPEQAREAREALGKLYRAAFTALGASPTATGSHTGGLSYVVLDTQAVVEMSSGFSARPEVRVEEELNEFEPTEPVREYVGFSRLKRRFTPRPVRKAPQRPSDEGGIRTPVDQWAESERRRLLIGAPGSGKSSFLMFTAVDILAATPQSAALQRAHAGDLPLWLPFGFLCRHLEGSTTNSVVSAIEAWVSQQGGDASWGLTQPALDDERAVLLVDGVDEWNDAASAEYALGLIESFVSQRKIGAILTARPYALDKLNWVTPWSKAVLAPLTDAQQVKLVHRALTESESFGIDGPTSPHAGTFLTELGRVPALGPLLRTPLFLGVLAKTWRGESLPPHRFRMFSELLRLLVERHPQMRRRASNVTGSDFSTSEMLTVLGGVAYQTRLEGGSSISSRFEMERRFRDELRRPDGLAYPASEAARVATAVLSQAEDEYGLLVPQGIRMVGFLHRVLLDQLAGEHLARLDPDVFEAALCDRVNDPTWRDVLLAGLAAQVNAHVNTSLLARLADHPGVDPVDKYELIAAAIAADVNITAAMQGSWIAEIIDRIADHPNTSHRIVLIGALVGSTIHASLRPRLLETFTHWLSASHPEPSSAIWMLRDSQVAEEGVLPALLWGLSHEDQNVQLNAAHAIAIRYASDVEIGAQIEARVREGGNAIDQAHSLLCLGTGWPQWPALPELILWARDQITPELRVCALHLKREFRGGVIDDLTSAERIWFATMFRHEGARPHEHWNDLALPFVQHELAQQPDAASFVLETLMGNGRNGGNRALAWFLACTTFSDHQAIKEWVSDELAHPDRRGLILHNLALIPETWRADPAFALNALPTIREEVGSPPFNGGIITLAESLPDDEAFDALLPALDEFRPVRAGQALLKRFGDDPRVKAEFQRRLRSTDSAGALAPLARDALGDAAGFEVLVDLLRDQSGDKPHGESKVIVAMAVADAWIDFTGRADDASIAAIVSRYDPEELATLCAGVGTRSLTWHVASVIAAWPDHLAVTDFALHELQHPRNIATGIHDPVPPAIIRTYGSRATTTANMMMNAVLGQLGYLPAELREALVDALTRSDLKPTVLLDLFQQWSDDPDSWVQRAALTGLIRRVNRYRISANAEPLQHDEAKTWLAEQVRAQLCAYGPQHDEQRQTAWIGMLLLNDLALHDGLLETIGEPTPPGTHLHHPLGGPDRELIELVNNNWETLRDHFGDDIFTLLSSTRQEDTNPGKARRAALSQLSVSSNQSSLLTDLIRVEAETDAEFRDTTEYLLWIHRLGRRDLDLFLSCLRKVDRFSRNGELDEVYELLLNPVAWDIPTSELRAALLAQSELTTDPVLRSLMCELFPDDKISQELFTDLESWFQTRETQQRREWFDTLTIVVSCSPANALPLIVERAHDRIIVGDATHLLPLLTAPLIRRLRRDPGAATALRSAILDPETVNAATPIWESASMSIAPKSVAAIARRVFLFGSLLRQAGLLDEDATAAVHDALATSPQVVVQDPFTGTEQTLRASSNMFTRPGNTNSQ